jgi:hypothetical protein
LNGSSLQLKNSKNPFYGFYGSFGFIPTLGGMNRERVRPARGGWRPARHIFIWTCGARRTAQRPGPPSRCCGAIKRSRSPDIPKLPIVATERAHWRMLSQMPEFVQAMMTPFFKTRNPCKY